MNLPTPFLLLVAIFILWSAFGYVSVINIEEPAFTKVDLTSETLTKERGFSMRQYEKMIIAETKAQGASYQEALNNGFRSIADYIFGNNTAKGKIAMTAQVVEQKGEKIAMTAPVIEEGFEQNGIYETQMSFVMPGKYTMETIPQPNNLAVTLREIPGSTTAVIRFSGWVDKKKAEKMRTRLRSVLEENGIAPTSEIRLAQYNPPWTPPWMRRNEVMVDVDWPR